MGVLKISEQWWQQKFWFKTIFFNFTTDLDLDFHIYKDGDNWYSSISIMCQKLAT
jgi:hypothetical protein